MTINPIDPIVAANFGLRPYAPIRPFVFVWGRTHADTLEDLRKYVHTEIVDHLNTENVELNKSIISSLADFYANVTEKINAVGEANDADLAELEAYVNESVASILNNSVQAQDSVVAGILGNKDSNSRKAADRIYASGSVNIQTLYDPANPPANFDAVFAAAVADGRPIELPPGDYPGEFVATDVPLRVFGPGRLIQRPGRGVVRATATPGPAFSILSITNVETINQASIGTNFPYQESLKQIAVTVPANITGTEAGDHFLIESEDHYNGLYVAGSTRYTYKRGWLTVAGIGVRMSQSAANSIQPGTDLTGQTSGAYGRVIAVAQIAGSTDRMVTFGIVNGGLFVNGESIIGTSGVVGTAVASPVILTTSLLNDTVYATAPKLRRPNTNVIVDIDVTIKAEGDPFALIGANARKDAVVISGVVNPQVKAHILSGYRRGVSIVSCKGGLVEVSGGNLPNDVSASEGAFGYAAEAMAATEGTVFILNVNGVRHGFTSNCDPQDGQPVGAVESLRSGTPKDIVVQDSNVTNTAGAGIDFHPGCVRAIVRNSVVKNVGSAGQNGTPAAGINNRGFDILVEDVTIINAAIGILDSAFTYDTEREFVNRYQARVYDYSETAFRHGSNLNGGNTSQGRGRYEFDIESRARSGVSFQTSALDLANVECLVLNLVAGNNNYADIILRTSLFNLTILKAVFDYRNSGSAGIGVGDCIRVKAAIRDSRNAFIHDIIVRENEAGDGRRSLFAVEDGVTFKYRRPIVNTHSWRIENGAATSMVKSRAVGTTGTVTESIMTNIL